MAGARDITVGSLCTGYGGLDLAISAVMAPTPTRLAWVSDIEPGPCKVLAARYPDVPNLGDLTTVDWSTVEPVDVLTAGYPCQPFSHAGQRKGTSDERHLWPHISDAIGVLRPRLVVLENVAGHLSLGGTAVIGGLTALGYDARWLVVRAADVGACHRRARLFIVANSDKVRRERTDRETRRETRLADRGRLLPTPNAHDGMSGASTNLDENGRRPSGSKAHFGVREAIAQLLPTPVANDDHKTPEAHIAAWDGDRGPDYARMNREGSGGDDLVTTMARVLRDGDVVAAGLTDEDAGRLGARVAATGASDPCAEGDADGEAVDELLHATSSSIAGKTRQAPNWGKYEAAIARHEAAVGRPVPYPTDEKGRLNPVFVEWMMMLPEGWITDILDSRTAALKILGNGVVPAQAAHALRLLEVA